MIIAYIIGGIVVAIVIVVAVRVLRARYRHEYIVNDGFVAIVYHEGKLADRLDAGRHVRWGHHYRIALIDVRKTLLQVQGRIAPRRAIPRRGGLLRQMENDPCSPHHRVLSAAQRRSTARIFQSWQRGFRRKRGSFACTPEYGSLYGYVVIA